MEEEAPILRSMPLADMAEEPQYMALGAESTLKHSLDEIVSEEDKQNAKAPRTGSSFVFEATGRVERIHLGNYTKDDQVAGVANIHGCLAQVAALCEPKSPLEKKMFDFFGVDNFGKLASSVRNDSRHLFCLMDHEAKDIMVKGGNAPVFYEKMKLLNAEIEEISDMGPTVESRLNERLKPLLELKEGLFNPGDIHTPGTKLLLALVAAELIKVEWLSKFDEMPPMSFWTTPTTSFEASFCGDLRRNGRRLPFLKGGDVFCAVGITCKPKEDSARSMLLLLPNEGHTVDDAFAELGRMYNANTVKWTPHVLVDLLFPKMDVELGMKTGGEDIIPWIKPSLPEIFNEEDKPFAYSFNSDVMKAHELFDAYVMKVKHCAAFKADHKGAKAEAVTVAAVGACYRSLGSEPVVEAPIPFHCIKPFGVLLNNGPVGGEFLVEFVAKIADKGVVRA